MADESISGLKVEPNKLPAMTMEQVKMRAERIFHSRGKPPYQLAGLSPDENEILGEQVFYWLPHFVEKDKS